MDQEDTKEEMISLISGNIFMKSYSLETVLKGGEWKTRRVFDFLFLGECARKQRRDRLL